MVVMAEASNGREAIELARRTKPDVIIMDVSMPVMDGEEATRRITAELPSVRIIGMSMYDDRATGMLEAGAAECLNKGGPSEALIAAIRGRAGVPRPQRSH
jgi:DNA-binding NarL/FixJ family response regulator